MPISTAFVAHRDAQIAQSPTLRKSLVRQMVLDQYGHESMAALVDTADAPRISAWLVAMAGGAISPDFEAYRAEQLISSLVFKKALVAEAVAAYHGELIATLVDTAMPAQIDTWFDEMIGQL